MCVKNVRFCYFEKVIPAWCTSSGVINWWFCANKMIPYIKSQLPSLKKEIESCFGYWIKCCMKLVDKGSTSFLFSPTFSHLFSFSTLISLYFMCCKKHILHLPHFQSGAKVFSDDKNLMVKIWELNQPLNILCCMCFMFGT